MLNAHQGLKEMKTVYVSCGPNIDRFDSNYKSVFLNSGNLTSDILQNAIKIYCSLNQHLLQSAVQGSFCQAQLSLSLAELTLAV